jgi:hypothetical protein
MSPSKSNANTKTAKRSTMTDAHKEALAIGRAQGRAVRHYLYALDRNRPKRGRKRTSDSIRKQLDVIDEKIGTADPLQKLHLIQQRSNLSRELDKEGGPSDDMGALEKEFVSAAKEYGERKGINYATWREAGVPAAVLEKARIRRGGS